MSDVTHTYQVEIEFTRRKSGEVTAMVRTRRSDPGADKPVEFHVIHDSHFLDDAVAACRRAANKARREIVK